MAHNSLQQYDTAVETAPVDEKQIVVESPKTESQAEEDGKSGISDSRLLRKLDLKLLPAVTLLYLLSFLDRSNGLSLIWLLGWAFQSRSLLIRY